MAIMGGDVTMIPGFYFQPTDEELLTYYLLKKFHCESFWGSDLILDFDVYFTEPWHVPRNSLYSKDRKSYYFLMAKRTSPGCTRLLRRAGNGYWHMNGTTKKIYDSNNMLAGTTTALTYMATTEGGKKKKTKWVMHEYRLDPSYFDKSQLQTMELVLCSLQESGRGEATQSNNENHPQPLLAAPETLLQKRPREDNPVQDETEDASLPRLLEDYLINDNDQALASLKEDQLINDNDQLCNLDVILNTGQCNTFPNYVWS